MERVMKSMVFSNKNDGWIGQRLRFEAKQGGITIVGSILADPLLCNSIDAIDLLKAYEHASLRGYSAIALLIEKFIVQYKFKLSVDLMLNIACMQGLVNCLKMMHKNNFIVIQNSIISSLLFLTTSSNQPIAFEFFLTIININNFLESLGESLITACSKGYYEIIHVLQNQGILQLLLPQDKGSALRFSTRNQQYKALKLLLEANIDSGIRMNLIAQCFVIAAETGNKDILQLLLDARPDQISINNKKVALKKACENNQYAAAYLIYDTLLPVLSNLEAGILHQMIADSLYSFDFQYNTQSELTDAERNSVAFKML